VRTALVLFTALALLLPTPLLAQDVLTLAQQAASNDAAERQAAFDALRGMGADGVQGLRIQRFVVEPGGGPREFVLKVTLIQAMRHESTASGLAEVVVHGMQGDRPARYSIGELLGRPKAQLPFSFRYFQTLEQAVTLPEGFQAFEAEVQVRSSKLRFPMQQSFPWKVGEEPPAA